MQKKLKKQIKKLSKKIAKSKSYERSVDLKNRLDVLIDTMCTLRDYKIK